ncbi:ABC transporter ATP-binding protein/permease [Amylibacter sp.]|nr:ABC transporter ATP-binding protein/permease [Amylibacter sp.]
MTDNTRSYRALFNHFSKYYTQRIFTVWICSLLAAITEGIGFLLITPLLTLLDIGDADIETTWVFPVFDKIGAEITPFMVFLLISMFFIMKGTITFIALYQSAILRASFGRERRREIYQAIEKKNYLEISRTGSGEFANLVGEQISKAGNAYHGFIMLGVYISTALIMIAIASLTMPTLVLALLIFASLILFLFKSINKKIHNLSRSQLSVSSSYLATVIEFISSFKYFQATARQDWTAKKVEKLTQKLFEIHLIIGKYAAFIQSIREPLSLLFLIAAMTTYKFAFNVDTASLIVVMALIYRSMNNIVNAQVSLQSIYENIAGLEKITKLVATSAISDTKNINKHKTFENSSIRLDGVTYKYNHSEVFCLLDVNMTIEKNHSVALIGASGSGKSTIADLICGLIRPHNGKIFLNGKDYTDIDLEAYRKQIGYVSQETALFTGTILENIIMENKFDAAHFNNACRQANILDFINSLPKGIHTECSTDQSRVSGGQKQRIAIARELYRNPNFIIFDEASSALDVEAQNVFKDMLNTLQGTITIFIITHNLDYLNVVDKAYRISDGSVVEISLV